MNNIEKIKETHNIQLEHHCMANDVSFKSIQLLLSSERTKKLLKRNAMIQIAIDKEIENALGNENR